MIRRGEVWWGDLGQPRGAAPALRRPLLIVSDDRYNASNLSTALVAVMTSNLRRAGSPGNVIVAAGLAGLISDSVVDVTQLATLDRGQFEERAGELPDWLMAQVDDGLRRVLSL